MWSSARVSSSLVEIPGRTASRSSCSVSPTTMPACRINAICSGVLISTFRSRSNAMSRSGRADVGVQDLDGALRDLVDRALGEHRAQLTGAPVEVDQRCRLVVVDLD